MKKKIIVGCCHECPHGEVLPHDVFPMSDPDLLNDDIEIPIVCLITKETDWIGNTFLPNCPLEDAK